MDSLKIYGGLTATQKLGSDKIIINELTQTELKKVFGEDGRYGSLSAIVFDVTSNRFYTLTKFDTSLDSIDVSNYSPIDFGSYEIPEYVDGNYGKGTMVSVTNQQTNDVEYYIAQRDVNVGETPQNSNFWFRIPKELGVNDIPRQIVYITQRDVFVDDERKVQITVDRNVSLNGNRIPFIQFVAKNIDGFYELVYPKLSIHKENNIILDIEFVGDLSFLHTDSNNIILTLI